MFWAFKLSFYVDILVFLGHFFQQLGEILFSFLVTLPLNDIIFCLHLEWLTYLSTNIG